MDAARQDTPTAPAPFVRLHVPGIDPASARAQLERLGDEVVGPLRKALR